MAYNYDEEKEKMRKEILDELNGKATNKRVEDTPYVSYGMKKNVVNFNIDYEKKDEKANQNIEPPKTSSIIMLFACCVLVFVGILFFPKISDKMNERKIEKENEKIHSNPVSNEKKKEEVVYEKLTLDSAKVKNTVYPVYHIDSSSKATYYSKDKMLLGNFTNSDLLYNSFVNFSNIYYDNYTGVYSGKSCTPSKVYVSSRYFNIVIQSFMGKSANINLANLNVPTYNPMTSLTGLWKYDAGTESYVYYGDCNKKSASTLYYDLRDIESVDNSEKNIELYTYNYIGFASVDVKTRAYVIYSDANYTKKVTSGTLTTNNYQNELNTIFKALGNKDSFNKYKYTFSTKDCPYSEYCFVSGEWVK